MTTYFVVTEASMVRIIPKVTSVISNYDFFFVRRESGIFRASGS